LETKIKLDLTLENDRKPINSSRIVENANLIISLFSILMKSHFNII